MIRVWKFAFTEQQFFKACDYAYTLLLSMIMGLFLWWLDIPWWVTVLYVHYLTASWFLPKQEAA